MNWQYFEPRFEYEKKILNLDWPWSGHKNFAYDLIRNIKPERVVELGTHRGNSFFSMCQAVKDGNLKTELYAVDTWKGDKHAGFYGEWVFRGINLIKNTYYSELNINFVRKTFDTALDEFSDNSIDILHIDGLHTYDAVKHDFEAWFKKVRSDGIILLHDTSEKSADFGVFKLWEEIKKKFSTTEFIHSHGLGVLYKNPKKFKGISDLKDIWNRYYFIYWINRKYELEIKTLGKGVQKQDKRISKQEKDIIKRDQEIVELKETIVELKETLQKRDQELLAIKSSRLWKLRSAYVKIRRKFLSK